MPKKRYTPAVRYLRYMLIHNGADQEDSHYIDLARDLSNINRRMYRQGKVYRIANITVHTTSHAFVKACSAPDSWVVRNAWKRGFKKWNKMNKLPGRTFSRWHDFKTRLIDDARTDPDQPLPIDSGDNVLEQGEWVVSEYVSPDGTTGADAFTSHLLGPHVGTAGSLTAVGLVYSYGEARGSVSLDSPNFDDGGDDEPLTNLFDDGTTIDEIAQNLDSYGDKPPYHVGAGDSDRGESYPGSVSNMPKPLVHGETAMTPEQSIGYITGFNVICGLLEFETKSDQETDYIEVLVELAPGDYKGIAAYAI